MVNAGLCFPKMESQILQASNTNELTELHENPTVLTLLDSAGFVRQQLSCRNAPVAV